MPTRWPSVSASDSVRGKLLAVLAVLPALLVAVPAFVATWSATVRASWTSLGRDQGIFQYVAWAVGKGDVLYRDVRDVNGPVIALVHLSFQWLGGADEHRFRLLDLGCSALAFSIAGALVPSVLDAPSLRGGVLARVAWALAGWVALSAQYVVYGFWDTAQRESFLDWFVVVSILLQASRHASGAPAERATRATLLAAGFGSFVPWLGKPTFAAFTIVQLVSLAIDSGTWTERLRRAGWFVLGGVAGCVAPLAFVCVRGDLGAWLRITFVDVPTMYRFIWPRPASAIFSLPGYSTLATTAILTSVGLGLLVVLRRLPRRALPIAAMPICGLTSVALQAKGFPYHFHPVSLGIAIGWLVALHAIWDDSWGPSLRARLRGVGIAVLALSFGARSAHLAGRSPDPPLPVANARDRDALESPERLAAFDRVDYFPRAMRDAASYVASHTREDERVQTYAMDAYLLFLAGRLSATPYIYAYDLNADAALHGSFDPGGLVPTERERARIMALRDEHARDLLARLVRTPPAAFLFADRSPLMSSEDSVADFAAHCPEAARWVAAHYRQTADFEGIRVWLRLDHVLEASSTGR